MTRYLVTGGTGAFGSALIRRLLADPTTTRVVCYARGEARLAQLEADLGDPPTLRCVVGDVRDKARLVEAMHGVEAVYHGAAIKRVEMAARNPREARRTNVQGSARVIEAAMAAGVRKVLLISSDKATGPTLYGATKLLMEREGIAANALTIPRGTAVACTRWGNVWGSTGSVLFRWQAEAAAGRPIPITDPRCTRFLITMDEAVRFARFALDAMRGGEVFVPALPAARVVDLAEALHPGQPTVRVGLRAGGERLHETLITEEEATRARYVATWLTEWITDARLLAIPAHYYVLAPDPHPWTATLPPWPDSAEPVVGAYTSGTTTWRLDVPALCRWLTKTEGGT